MTITKNILFTKKLITEYEEKYGREKNSVQLLLVSKGQSTKKIIEAFHAGQRLFAESYLQEALKKMADLASLSAEIEWHFIGPLQSNKTRKIAEHFTWVHSVESEKIAKRLNEQRPTHLPPLNICIQINISHEQTKSGINIKEVVSLLKYCHTLPQLRIRGLMAIPAKHFHLHDQRYYFHQLFILYQSLCQQGFALDTLSMGMSNDFEAAIAEGATFVRIGSAIFGERR